MLIVDCPTSSHLPELLSLHSLSSCYGDMSGNPPETSKAVNCIIHLSPAAVTNTKDYQKWMTKFTGAQHIMAGHEMLVSSFPNASLYIQKKNASLSCIDCHSFSSNHAVISSFVQQECRDSYFER